MRDNLPVNRRSLWLSLAISLASLVVILYFTVDENTFESVLRLKPSYLLLSALMVVVMWLLEGLRIKTLAAALGHEGSLRLRDMVRVHLITFFFAGVTPMAFGEWPAQIYGLSRCGLPAGRSAAVSLVRTVLSKSVFVVLAAFLLFVDGRAASGSGVIFRLFRYAFWVLTATTSFYLLMLWQAGLAQAVLTKLQRFRRFQALYGRKPKLRAFIGNVLGEAVRFQETAHQINRGTGLRFFGPFVLTLAFWSVMFAVAPVLLLGLGVVPDVRAAVAWQVMIMLLIPYVPLPGGSGLAEFGLATLFSSFVPAHLIGVFILAWRFFTYYLTLITGGLTVFILRK